MIDRNSGKYHASSMEIYLSVELQEFLFLCQRCIFIVTFFLNILSMFCLLKKTPPNQAGIRAYLVIIQVPFL